MPAPGAPAGGPAFAGGLAVSQGFLAGPAAGAAGAGAGVGVVEEVAADDALACDSAAVVAGAPAEEVLDAGAGGGAGAAGAACAAGAAGAAGTAGTAADSCGGATSVDAAAPSGTSPRALSASM